MLKNNTCFFRVLTVVLPASFFFVSDRWVLSGVLVFVVCFGWKVCVRVMDGLSVSRILLFFSVITVHDLWRIGSCPDSGELGAQA